MIIQMLFRTYKQQILTVTPVSTNIKFAATSLYKVSSFLYISTHSQGASTMVNKCNSIHGTTCINWNHEGQWMLGENRKLLVQVLNSGSMCPVQTNSPKVNYSVVADILHKEWSRYWVDDQPILVEKSPQSMLKIMLLHKLFSKRYNLKFLIIIKVNMSYKKQK